MNFQDLGTSLENHRTICGKLLLASALGVALALINLGSAFAEQDLSKDIENARGDFKPVSQKQVDDARAELKQRMRDVEQFVKPSSENGKRWLRYLRWESLKDQVNEKEPKDVDALDDTITK